MRGWIGSHAHKPGEKTPEQKDNQHQIRDCGARLPRAARVPGPAHVDAMSQPFLLFVCSDHAVANAENEHARQRRQVHLHVPHQQRVGERVTALRAVTGGGGGGVESSGSASAARGRVHQRLREGCARRERRLQYLGLVRREHVHVQPQRQRAPHQQVAVRQDHCARVAHIQVRLRWENRKNGWTEHAIRMTRASKKSGRK